MLYLLIASAPKISVAYQIAHSPYWALFALLEGLFIVWLVLLKRRKSTSKSPKSAIKETVLGEDQVDFANTIHSAFHSQQLYDELKVKCHPDRFPNDPIKTQLANELFQQISKHRYDHKRLTELKDAASEQLFS